ncbi:MAG: uracil-DNA glycosylase [Polaromonas sp.]|nr:uracil-DNA glycosylase [Polaromonas sp.]MBP7308126.1 uracil-DNA glycosylase [Polaromonas sp.]MBP8873717.1 uracil-DNA glycosylase [Polaromonas sp.]MBP9057076.1 uracil-DNA glycosylase [Polaromonas sp.]
MSLELDTRQRAMLHEMGIVTYSIDVVIDNNAIEKIAPQAINTTATGQKYIHNLQNSPVTASASVTVAKAATTSTPTPAQTPQQQSKPAQQAPAAPAVLPEMPAGLQSMDWPALQQAASTCQSCHLCSSRKQGVFGIAASSSDNNWLVVGDPPSEADELQSLPFTGEAADLLAKMLKAIQLDMGTQVTLTSAAKCRSSGKSTGVNELLQCSHYLRRQIALKQPKMILAMGRYAAQALLQQAAPEPLGKLRGVVHRVEIEGQSYPVIVTYTPQLLLKTPADKAKAWADLQLAKQSV